MDSGADWKCPHYPLENGKVFIISEKLTISPGWWVKMRSNLKKAVATLAVILVCSSGLAYMFSIPQEIEEPQRTEPMILTVGVNGDFLRVNVAIDAAIPGDVIELAPGIYDEFINLDKPIWLRGAKPQSIPSDVPDDGVQGLTGGHVMMTGGIMVTADSATVSDMVFSGIKTVPTGTNNNNPDWSPFSWNSAGIITMAWGAGTFESGHIDGLTVTGCTFTNCWQGIFLFGARSATVTGCTFRDCYRGITIRDHYYSPDKSWISSNNLIENCNFYDQLYYDPDTGDPVSDENGEAIVIFDCDDNTIRGGEMSGNTYGVRVYKGSRNKVENVKISTSTQSPMLFREITEGITVSGTNVIEDGKSVTYYKCDNFIFQNNKLDGTTLELMNSTKGVIRDNDFEQTDTPALSIGTVEEHFDHDIGQSNNIAGESIYYFNNDDRLSLRDVTAGAVYVMNCDGGLLADLRIIGGDGIIVYKSDGVTIENVRATNNIFGIDVQDASDMKIVGTIADTGGRGRFGVRLHNITTSTIEDSVIRTYGTEHSIRLTGGTFCSIHNSTFDDNNVQVRSNDGGVLQISNNLNIRVMKEGMAEPFDGAQVLVSQDSEPAYATTFFGGSDPATNAKGRVGPISLVDRVYHHSNTPLERFHTIQVWAEIDGIWTESKPNLDMSVSRTETFEIDDIWAPGSPINVRVVDLPDEDAIEITWFPPMDVDTSAVSIYSNMSGQWRQLERFPTTNTIFRITSGLVHGTSYYFRLTAWDGEGLESKPTPVFAVVHVDRITPPAPQNLYATNVSAFTCQLNWGAVTDEDLVGYHVYVNDTDVGPSGPWVKVSPLNGISSNLFQVNGLKSETTYFFAVSAFDEVPNESPFSPTIKVETPDVTPPARPVLFSLPAYTNQKQLAVSGLAEAGVTVSIFVDGEVVGTTIAAGDKRFSLDINLTEGPNIISARATDNWGNHGMFSKEVTVVLDTVTPDAPVLDPLPEITGEVSILVTGIAEGGSMVTVYVDDIEAAITESIVYVGFSAHVTLTEGWNAISARAIDRASNTGPRCEEVGVILDTVPPLEPVVDELPSITRQSELTVSGVAEPDAVVEVYLEDYMAGSGATGEGGMFSIDITLLEGFNYLMVRVIDVALNPSRSTLPVEILLDTIPPSVYVGPDIKAVEGSEILFDGSTSYDNQGITGYLWTFTVDGVAETRDTAHFMYTFDHPMEVLMTLTVTDVAGNEASASLTVDIVTSNKPPRLTLGMVDPPEGHSATSFEFQVTFWDDNGDLGTVNIVLDGETQVMTADPSDSDTTDGQVYTFSTKLKTGDHSYHFLGTDAFGFEATGPCVGEGNQRTMTVYDDQTSATPSLGAVMTLAAMGVLGAALVLRRRREVVS